MKKDKVSVIIPVYYNSESLRELYADLCGIPELNTLGEMEIVFVDDGSGDNSFEIIRGLASKDKRVRGIKLSRNFGSFVACLAGLAHCTGNCAVIISADLQDPPGLIGAMYKKWKEGNKVVMAVREERKEGFFKVLFARIFYKLFRLLVTNDMPKNGFDYVLIDRQVVDVLTSIREKNTTLMGLILWMGFSRAEVPYTRMERKHGKSRWTLYKKINYFLDSIMAFSQFPIRIFSVIGIFLSGISIIGIVYVIVAYFLGWIEGVAGWPSLMVITLFMFGILFLGLGMMGEYIWRNLEETRKRPLFLVDTYCNKVKAEANFEQK
ncbi:MAG: glycosyltransferase family 2 protein [Candidatus Aureabacteria bacterium]|nr:glycosyltransferase family 2 protein [Candidatus Auribacterota bacterium]